MYFKFSKFNGLLLSKFVVFPAFAFLLLLPLDSYAVFPRAYVAAPAGTTALASYFNLAESDGRYSSGSKLATDVKVSSMTGLLRPLHYFDWMGKRMVVNAVIPFGEASIEGSTIPGGKQTSSGLADPLLHFAVFLVNEPSNQYWIGLGEYLTVPMGEYDNTNAINLGGNRYVGKTELGIVKGFDKYMLELTTAMSLFQDNDDFGAANGNLEQDTLWNVEVQLSRNLDKNSFIALAAIHQWGGETKLNGVSRDDAQRTDTLQLSYSNKIAPGHTVVMYYKEDLKVENGFKMDRFSLRYTFIY